MSKNKVFFNEQELNNLKIFLERVDLKGSEVPAYLEIVQRLSEIQLEKQVE